MASFFSSLALEIKRFQADTKVYWSKRGSHSTLASILYMLTCHGWHVMFWFRLGKVIYAFPIPVVSHVLKILFQITWFFVTTFYGVWLDLSNQIGKGFYIGHFGGIIVRGDFGDYCSIGQCVTVGTKGAGKSNGHPRLGDRVYVGAGAKLIGNIEIGSDVIIGANAVVLEDVASQHRAVGVPAKITPISKLTQLLQASS